MGLKEKTALVAFVALSLVIINGSNISSDGTDTLSTASSDEVRLREFELPKLFDFQTYKRLFGKTYSSEAQELARQKIFLAKAMNVFVSAIKYKHHESTYYKGINKFSDRTKKEMFQMKANLMRKNVHASRAKSRGSFQLDEAEDVAIDETTVKKTLMAAMSESNPNHEFVKEELNRLSVELEQRRQKRDTGEEDTDRNLGFRDLFRTPKKFGAWIVDKTLDLSGSMIRVIDKNSQTADSMASIDPIGLMDALYDGVPASKLKTMYSVQEASGPKEYRDWIKETPHCFVPARDQGDCGSCYAHASITLLEHQHCVQTGKLVEFSPQYMISCGIQLNQCIWDAKLGGCQGSTTQGMFTFLKYYGVELEQNVPYQATNGTCPVDRKTPITKIGHLRPRVTKYKRIEYEEVSEALKEGPLLAAILLPEDISDYSGGIAPGFNCDDTTDHMVVVVSEGITDGVEWFGLLNSWGPEFGEGGVLKLAKNDQTCFDEFIKIDTEFKTEAASIATPLKTYR